VLVDGEKGISQADKVGLEMMEECSRPYTVSLAFTETFLTSLSTFNCCSDGFVSLLNQRSIENDFFFD
jgi:hypothetical protein